MPLLTELSHRKFKAWLDQPHLTPYVAITHPFGLLDLGWMDRDEGLDIILSRELGYWITEMDVAVESVVWPNTITYRIEMRFDDVPTPCKRD